MNILITGGHSGMGFELSKKLLAEGHRLGLIVRSEARKAETLKLFPAQSTVDVFVADLSKRDAIEAVAVEVQAAWETVDGLFNNAGVLLDKLYLSDYGNELQLEINAISPYLLTKALMPALSKAAAPFVVSTATSALQKRKALDIPAFKQPKKFTKLTGSYMDSKLTMVALMNHLSTQFPQVRFASVNPGPIKTKMTAGSGMPLLLRPIRNLLFKSPEHGASKLYEGAFGKQFAGSGIYISGGKETPMKASISSAQLDQLLAQA